MIERSKIVFWNNHDDDDRLPILESTQRLQLVRTGRPHCEVEFIVQLSESSIPAAGVIDTNACLFFNGTTVEMNRKSGMSGGGCDFKSGTDVWVLVLDDR
jgi:hypothetical protein